ncbi:MAG: DUF2958 domain-containing protein [Pseudomonadota bacterium]
MEVFNPDQLERARENGRLWLSGDLFAAHMVPVIKLFVPGTACTWLAAAVHSHDPDRLLGLCDVAAVIRISDGHRFRPSSSATSAVRSTSVARRVAEGLPMDAARANTGQTAAARRLGV